jgi:hypothetical protein
MLKDVNSNPFNAVALVALAAMFTGNVAPGQSNPVAAKMDVTFIRGGISYEASILVNGIWHPDFTGWNDKFASDETTKIPNIATSLSFPLDPSGINITAAEVNAYEDALHVGAGRIGEPTWSYNCHGHSTGLGFWINSDLSELIAVEIR